MPRYRFSVQLSAAEVEDFYHGRAAWIQVRSQGKKIRLPWGHFRPFISHNGLHGQFELELDPQHRFVKLEPR